MVSVIFLALIALIVTARACPDTCAGRFILDVFVDGPARWLAEPNWKKTLPYALVATGAALLILSAPELAPLAAGLDLSLMADILLVGVLVATQLGQRRLRTIGRYIRQSVIRQVRRARRARRRRSTRRARPASGDGDAPGALAPWAFA